MFDSGVGKGSFMVLNLITSTARVCNERYGETNKKMVDDTLRHTIPQNPQGTD